MLDYYKCIRLKASGYPQPLRGQHEGAEFPTYFCRTDAGEKGGDYVLETNYCLQPKNADWSVMSCPDSDEMVEYLGTTFSHVEILEKGLYRAWGYAKTTGTDKIHPEGPTMLDALAELCIAIRGNNDN